MSDEHSDALAKVVLARFHCDQCGVTFIAPALPDMSYGQFLLWSHSGRVVFLDAFADTTFTEAIELLTEIDPSEGDKSSTLHRLYGALVCDPDEDGSVFHLEGGPVCPQCGGRPDSLDVATSTPTVLLTRPTHKKWNAASREEKLRSLRTALSSIE